MRRQRGVDNRVRAASSIPSCVSYRWSEQSDQKHLHIEQWFIGCRRLTPRRYPYTVSCEYTCTLMYNPLSSRDVEIPTSDNVET